MFVHHRLQYMVTWLQNIFTYHLWNHFIDIWTLLTSIPSSIIGHSNIQPSSSQLGNLMMGQRMSIFWLLFIHYPYNIFSDVDSLSDCWYDNQFICYHFSQRLQESPSNFTSNDVSLSGVDLEDEEKLPKYGFVLKHLFWRIRVYIFLMLK